MADYYSQCVVQPSIPDRLVDKADRLALEGLGYTFEEDGEDWYLFAAEGENSTAWGINPNDWIEVIDAVYPPGVERPAWMERLVDHLSSAIKRDSRLRTMIAADWDLDLTAVPLSGAEIFQAMLQKPVNTGERAIKEITIEGSLTVLEDVPRWLWRLGRAHHGQRNSVRLHQGDPGALVQRQRAGSRRAPPGGGEGGPGELGARRPRGGRPPTGGGG